MDLRRTGAAAERNARLEHVPQPDRYGRYPGGGIIGSSLRIHSLFKGTSWNRASTSGWIYLKITD